MFGIIQSIILVFLMFIVNVMSAQDLQKQPDFSHFPSHVCDFLTKHYDRAAQIEQLHGIPIAITLGVSAFESGYGTSFRAKKWNNFFGIRKRKYMNAQASFDDFALLMKTERYNHLFLIPKESIVMWATRLQAAGYNPKPSYVERLLHVIAYINRRNQFFTP